MDDNRELSWSWHEACRVYTKEVAEDLAARFDISLPFETWHTLLKDIGHDYFYGWVLSNSIPDDFFARSKEVSRVMRSRIAKFGSALDAFGNELHVGQIMQLGILEKDLAAIAPELCSLPEFDRGQALAAMLKELLKTLDRGIKNRGFQKSAGRRPDMALHLSVSAASFVWRTSLGRKFTLDYAKGKGLTPAFEFCKAVLAPVGPISDQRIITAMRADIRERSSGNNTDEFTG